VDYFSLIDAVLQSGDVAAVDCRTAMVMLAAGINAFEHQPAVLLQQTDAVLALASAVASLVKIWSMYVRGVALLGATHVVEPNRRALSAVPELVSILNAMGWHLRHFEQDVASSSCIEADASNTVSGVGSTAAAQQQQQTASHVLLSVLLARSVVMLADAAEAAAEQAGGASESAPCKGHVKQSSCI
jgi:hypothetical protein